MRFSRATSVRQSEDRPAGAGLLLLSTQAVAASVATSSPSLLPSSGWAMEEFADCAQLGLGRLLYSFVFPDDTKAWRARVMVFL